MAGNLTSRQTANLQKEGKRIEYKYDRNRLTEIIYPNHEENNVRYTYGGPNAEHNRVGRIALQEDGSGAQEFFYGTLGEVIKTRRTLIIPNVAVATYTTEWKYDSFGRLLEMTYPDGEKIVYKYDLGGNLCKVFGKKNYLYTYIDTIAYDLFGQRSYIRYGNGAETRYSYSSNRRRLSTLAVKTKETEVMNNTYKYDVMDNITQLVGQGKPQTLQDGKSIGGAISHAYSYDEWDRLIGAKGSFDAGTKSAEYNLRMEYDKLYNVTSKQLDLKQNNLQFAGSLKTGYTLNYNYKEDDPFRLETIDSKEYSSENPISDTVRRTTSYDFDENGNLTLQLVDTQKDSAHVADTMGTRVKNHLWDEENRLLAINDNGFVSNYFYDANGERTVKLSKPDLYVYVNSAEKLKGDSLTMKFIGYVSPYLVVTNGGRYTKHIYAGTQRIASKLGDINAFGADPRRVATAGHDVENIEPIDFSTKYKNQNDAFKSRFDSLGAKFNGKTLDDYVNGQSFCCGDNSLDEIERNSDKPESAKKEDNLYFYHPDHLGSTSIVTNYDGEVSQNVAYIPYGEVFVEERNGSWATPFLFNAKEMDEETGLYYYGARYYDPTAISWLSVDPKWGDYKGVSPYAYCLNNPVKLVDPDGEHPIYDEEGNLLGTDNKGLQGDPFVFSKDYFEQGMTSELAAYYDLGLDFLSNQTEDKTGTKPYDRFLESFTNLPNRPDWDGVVTDLEARAWWNSGSGEDLYIDVSKIDLSPLTRSDFKNEEGNILQFNFFLSPRSSKTTARVHGTLTMRLKNIETGEVGFFRDNNGYIDTYDFNGDGRIIRDITTWGARQIVGEGKGYGFRPYGKNPTLKK